MQDQANNNIQTLSRLLYKKAEAAQLLGVSLRTIDNMILRKDLKIRKIGRSVRISADELRRFAAANTPARLAA